MLGRILSIYVLFLLFFTLPAYAEETESTPAGKQAMSTTWADAAWQSADWAYVMRDESSATYLRMDTITRKSDDDAAIFCGDIKKVYTKHGLLQVYHSLKNKSDMDADSLALLKEIDYAVMHVSYRNDGRAIFHRLHRVTFYNKSGSALETLDFDDIACQTDTEIAWQEVTRQMTEEKAIFYRLANG